MKTQPTVIHPIFRPFGKNASIESTDLGEAMIIVGLKSHHEEVIRNKDILAIVV